MKDTTKDLQIRLVHNAGYTTVPEHIRTCVARSIQEERPWSDLPYEEIRDAFYESTCNGCTDVYVSLNGADIGWAHLAETWDAHVGVCAVVTIMYVLPRYRDLGAAGLIVKALVQEARKAGYRWCMYSHWTKPRELKVRYIDLGVNNGSSQ